MKSKERNRHRLTREDGGEEGSESGGRDLRAPYHAVGIVCEGEGDDQVCDGENRTVG